MTQGFDASGYLTAATPASGDGQVRTWDALHQLTTSVTGTGATAKTTRFVYGANGDRLIRQTPGNTTVTAGITEIVFPAGGGAATGRRTLTLAGTPVAVATTAGGTASLSYLAGDGQASTQVAITSDTQAVSRTRYTPYGAVRASTSPLGALGTGLPTDKGFLGKNLGRDDGLVGAGGAVLPARIRGVHRPRPPHQPRRTQDD